MEAFAGAVTHVFSWVVPVALAGFVIALFLKEVPLRDSSRAAATDLGEGFSAPDSADSVCQLERAVAGVFRQVEDRGALHDAIMADSCTRLTTQGQARALGQVHVRTRFRGKRRWRRSPEAIACRPMSSSRSSRRFRMPVTSTSTMAVWC